ncbi:MAG: hypothetical protein LBB13_00415 [Rickettsiales bacterium]|jgi:hypothetical protein|nr:hypothetical protein [Rickettsiales bacterium]
MSAEKTTKDRSTGEKKKREFNHVSNIPSVNKGNTHKEVEKFMEKRRREKLAEKLSKERNRNLN